MSYCCWLLLHRHTDGSGFFTPLFGHGWLTLYIAFSFLLTWNVIAMEAAACYIGETKNPDRDRKSTRLNSSHSRASRMPSSA